MIPIKRGTARRLGLKLPQPKMLWLDGDAFRRPVGSLGPWVSVGEVEAMFTEPSAVDVARGINRQLARATMVRRIHIS